ncbi:alpha-mannosidase 2x-like [Liolophura sinensis]|uniref:alpha-mannosidase 2x-like n=1 Tax=Liolophura sinensis TaxID=3198878 RepID=UPI003159512D
MAARHLVQMVYEPDCEMLVNMALNMKFKVRLIFFVCVAMILLMTFFLYLRESSPTRVRKADSGTFFLSKIKSFFPVSSEKCSGTLLVNVTADMQTVNIWDSIDLISAGTKYKVMFPEENSKKAAGKASPSPLTVLIIPHSHNDPGWLRTLDDYFSTSTKKIFDLMLEKLEAHPDMRMVWAETVFLALWYEQASVENRTSLKKLVDTGQLDLVTGGWVMPDEASTHYYSIIDQLIEGHQWLARNLGARPRINWSIDPFGHSGTVPHLWRLANFDGMVIQRIHQAIKDYLGHHKRLVFHWRQIWDDKGYHDILCHTMPYLSYDTTATCGPDSNVCRKYLFPYNQEFMAGDRARLEAFVTPLYEQFRLHAENYQHNVIFVPLGGDFQWVSLDEFDSKYSSYTEIMAYMNSRSDWNIKVRFGTLTEYFNLLKQASPPVRYPTVTGDFFVYSEIPNHYWSGYFTSRPLDKFLGREIQALLKVADILYCLAAIHARTGSHAHVFENYKLLEVARRNLALYQHHDAITGTAKPHVVMDYEIRLSSSFNQLQAVVKHAVVTLLRSHAGGGEELLNVQPFAFAFDPFHSRSRHEIKPAGLKVVVFNPSAFKRAELISLVTDKDQIEVNESRLSNRKVAHQISPVWSARGNILSSRFELSFRVDLPPWSLVTYTLSAISTPDSSFTNLYMTLPTGHHQEQKQASFKISPLPRSTNIVLENACLRVSISSSTGMITEIMQKNTNTVTGIAMEMVSYTPGALSGAYLFWPRIDTPRILSTDEVNVVHVQGSLYSAVKVVHPLFQTVLKVYNSSTEEALCRAVGIDNIATLSESRGDELVMRFKTDVQNKDVLYTDGNGLGMVKRRRFPKLPMPAAYYPMTSAVTIQDEHMRFTVHSRQPHGAASLTPGSLEIMLDRTFRSDDGKGLGEGIQQNPPAPSKFFLLIEPMENRTSQNSDYFHPTLQSLRLGDVLQSPLYYLTYGESLDLPATFNPQLFDLPCDANVVSFRPLEPDTEPKGLRTAFILEKRGYECGAHTGTVQCESSWGKLSFSSLLELTSPSSLTEMSLSLIDTIKPLSPFDTLELQAMDIKTYSLEWDDK